MTLRALRFQALYHSKGGQKMAYGNNRAGEQARAHFQLAGGSIIKFRHPYLAGQINADYTDASVDEILNLAKKAKEDYGQTM